MEKLLDKARKAVVGCTPKSDSSYARAVKALLAVVVEFRQYIKTNAQSDRGCAQRLVRELDELLSGLPSARQIALDKSTAHTRRLAESYLEAVEQHLVARSGELQEAKSQEVPEWVAKQPVLSEVKRITSGHLPKGAYVLLFCRGEEKSLELVTQTAQDGRVFTRFRPLELKDDAKLHHAFKNERKIIGAAVIAAQELLVVAGTVPAPEEGQEQLQCLLHLSNQAASTPVREFLEQNPVLKELHRLASRHKLPKQSYILLYQLNAESSELILVSKAAADNRTVTRFWPNEFSDKYKLFDSFREKPPLAGAAVIQHGKLLNTVGELPPPADGQTQVQVLLEGSSKALEQPLIDFIAGHVVLKALYDLARSESHPRDAFVILFAQKEGGTLEVVSTADNTRQVRIPLLDFVLAKSVYERFSKHSGISGASVICEDESQSRNSGAQGSANKRDADSDARKRQRFAPASKPVVVAAFGRTPLKAGHLATSETCRRLGIEF